MPTTNQLVRKPRKSKGNKSKSRALKGNPMVRGVVLKTFVRKPKKPNSAERKVCRVRLSTGIEVTAFFPGKGHKVSEHNTVLVRGGRVPDLPGVRYTVIRGALDCDPCHDEEGGRNKSKMPRTNSRSKYGRKKPS